MRYFFILLAAVPLMATKYAGEPFNMGMGARPLGLGNSYVAVAEDPTSVYWNPAGLRGARSRQVFLMHSDIFGGLLRMDFLSFSIENLLGDVTGGIGLYILNSPGIKQTALKDTSDTARASNVGVIDELNYNLIAMYLAGARDLLGGRLGMSIKVLQEDLSVEKGIGMGVDLGYQRTGEHVSYGIVLRDAFMTPIFWSSGRKEYIMPNLRLGISFQRKGSFLLTADLQTFFENRSTSSPLSLSIVSFEPSLGLEINVTGFFKLRGGLDRGNPAFGAGINTNRFDIDYAFLAHSDLGSSYRISLTGRL
ncbi:MAG: hypothetical protein J7K11_03485 [Candidatus Hydrothermae bacterium]|nr:hypothetical protein [Candidatus Hydrothermae bacterium]